MIFSPHGRLNFKFRNAFARTVRSTSSICILTKLLESKDFTVTLAVQLLCGPFGSNAHKPAGVQMFNSVYLETRTIVARANPSLEFSSQLVYTLWYLRQPKAAYLLTQFGFTSFEVFAAADLEVLLSAGECVQGCFANTAMSRINMSGDGIAMRSMVEPLSSLYSSESCSKATRICVERQSWVCLAVFLKSGYHYQ